MPKFHCQQNRFSSTYITTTSHEVSRAWKSDSHVKSRLVYNLSLHSKTYYQIKPVLEVYKSLPRMPQQCVLFYLFFLFIFLIIFFIFVSVDIIDQMRCCDQQQQDIMFFLDLLQDLRGCAKIRNSGIWEKIEEIICQ